MFVNFKRNDRKFNEHYTMYILSAVYTYIFILYKYFIREIESRKYVQTRRKSFKSVKINVSS